MDAHHLLDETPGRTRASFIVRALRDEARLDAEAVAALHCSSIKSGAVLDPPVRTSLLTAYARSRRGTDDVRAALALFHEAADPDLILWNAAVGTLARRSRLADAVALFRQMAAALGTFDSTTLTVMLSGASRAGDLELGTVLHAAAAKRGLADTKLNLCNALVDMYAKCGRFRASETVFWSMPCWDTASWNSMIGGSTFNGLSEVSARYFRDMARLAVPADEVTLSSVLSASARGDDLFSFGMSVHGCVVKSGYECTESCSVPNSLITFYSRLGFPEDAEKVFLRIPNRNLVSWNAMIKGMVENEKVREALAVFREMASEFQPDLAALVTVISGCADQGLLCEGKEIHGYVVRKGLLNDDDESCIGNSLLRLYMKCDDSSTANLLFRTMPTRDLISWNTMISGHSRDDTLRAEAQAMFKELLSEGLCCTLTTILAVIPSCSRPDDLGFGKAVHSLILKNGFASGVSVVNALMHMYICCGDSLAAFVLLGSIMPVSDIISWNTVIVGCVHNELHGDALEAFRFMHSTLRVNPDSITLVSVLSACGTLKLQSLGKSIHCMSLKHLVACNLRVKNALLTMYFRFADTESAELIFYSLGDRNLCSWNSMISGFAQNNQGWRALQFYQKMEDFAPNEMSTVGVICACTQLGDLRHGKSIHGRVVKSDLQNNVFVSASLVDMYSKCGRLGSAVKVFESSAEKSIACWNSMISALGFHGHGLRSIELFCKMIQSGIKATRSTFIALLSACGHSGLTDEGWKYYHLMSEKFGITPTAEHHVCMVDMLGRAGRLQDAHKFVESLPSKGAHGVWGALLSSCSYTPELKMGESIAKHLLCLEPENSGYYVTISNLYAYQDISCGAVQVRGILHHKGLMKPRGHSIVG
ncbi:pentatricopeptide repeat-containing protein At4g19220, mitochondrial-like [Lolium rigidum]|uniref:pentatricopeptide repeat-containing protein At4g19220, mitochondrial-like n=1 Tax=Lolium rigidum TaxID=89674 RepID=UPI001F5DA535|nr:pentatricopeptide repeat-containing protein At4g19220, mitochondrial-like [Lolium rigidum]